MQPSRHGDRESASSFLAHSAGTAYLALIALLLVVVALLALDKVLSRSGLGARTESAAAAKAVPKPAEELAPAERAELYARLGELGADLASETARRNHLAERLATLLALRAELGLPPGSGEVEAKGSTADGLQARLEEIERELTAVAKALEVEEQRISLRQTEIAGLGLRLNRALLVRIEELQKGRSEFFTRLRQVLGDRPEFRLDGDRFTLPSEVLFAAGSDRLSPQGVDEVHRLAATINAVRKDFPPELAWVLRVGGHTDPRPIANPRFPSNWELSALRAVTVVKSLVADGVPPDHVAAAGFAEFQPISPDTSDAGLSKNRRIEFRLDTP